MQLPHMIPGINTIDRKVSVASVNKACGFGGVLRPQRGFRRQSPLGKFLASKWHLDWLKIDLNAAKITTVQYCKHTKLLSMEIQRAKQVKFLGFKEHLDWLKIDFNAAKNYDNNKKIMRIEVFIYSVKTKSQAGNI